MGRPIRSSCARYHHLRLFMGVIGTLTWSCLTSACTTRYESPRGSHLRPIRARDHHTAERSPRLPGGSPPGWCLDGVHGGAVSVAHTSSEVSCGGAACVGSGHPPPCDWRSVSLCLVCVSHCYECEPDTPAIIHYSAYRALSASTWHCVVAVPMQCLCRCG